MLTPVHLVAESSILDYTRHTHTLFLSLSFSPHSYSILCNSHSLFKTYLLPAHISSRSIHSPFTFIVFLYFLLTLSLLYLHSHALLSPDSKYSLHFFSKLTSHPRSLFLSLSHSQILSSFLLSSLTLLPFSLYLHSPSLSSLYTIPSYFSLPYHTLFQLTHPLFSLSDSPPLSLHIFSSLLPRTLSLSFSLSLHNLSYPIHSPFFISPLSLPPLTLCTLSPPFHSSFFLSPHLFLTFLKHFYPFISLFTLLFSPFYTLSLSPLTLSPSPLTLSRSLSTHSPLCLSIHTLSLHSHTPLPLHIPPSLSLYPLTLISLSTHTLLHLNWRGEVGECE